MNDINIFREDIDIDFFKDHITELVNLSLKDTEYDHITVNLIFCDNRQLNSFKREYFNDDVLTDILTFPIRNDNNLEAEIYISVEMAKSNSVEFDVSLNNELIRLIVHGILHLIGFNDNIEKSKKVMFSKQEEIISNFKKDICYEQSS